MAPLVEHGSAVFQIPACQPCQNAGSICDYTDGRSGDVHPRSHIHDLETQLMRLEAQIQELDDAEIEVSPHTSTLRSDDEHAQDLIRSGDEGHAHYIGASSGMYLVRSVLESAQQNYPNFESPSETTEVRVGPKDPVSSNTRIALPSRETANSLIDTFFSQYQVQYPILDQKEFTKAVTEFYDHQNDHTAPRDVWTRFMLNMVLAISLMFMAGDHSESTVLSKGFTANAMSDIGLIMQTKNVQSLQCLLLLLLLSILDSSSAPVWYISGLCMRMCIDLGYHSETTIAISSSAVESEAKKVSEADMKRRLFWVTYSFDRTLNILLGRPFTFDDFTVNIHLPKHSLVPSKRPQILHWLELQRLESEIVHKLHAVRKDAAVDGAELTEWTNQMARRLKAWNSVALTLTDSDGHNINWWGYWYRTALLILYRPSPLRPNLSASDTLLCYEGAKDLIQLSFLRINEGLMDFTWIDLHFQFMSGVTLVFIVWKNTEARMKAKEDWISLKSCLFQWKTILEKLGARWERIARAREALSKLADATIDLVEKDMMRSAGGGHRLPIHHDSGEARRDRRRSILQQLRRQDSDSMLQRNSAHVGGDTGMQDSSPLDTNAELSRGGMRSTYQSNTSSESHQRSAASASEYAPQSLSENWTAFDSSTNTQQQEFFADIQGQSNMSSMLTEEIWPLFDLSDVAVAPDELNFWSYFSAPMLSADEMGSSQLNTTGRVDESFTNSILNFHGDLNNITPEMAMEYPDDGDYGYHAGQ
ncbi:purine utilization positive regulator [Fusarium beomiforme]|uniref:Purine utilization positive regulator n=1 Tax=Fusarium beomiforme TaxID=44412 RepID=A0A9P5AHY2_9HYPO|nr:purine utilization positive regulator [Fusarium beomiforme]